MTCKGGEAGEMWLQAREFLLPPELGDVGGTKSSPGLQRECGLANIWVFALLTLVLDVWLWTVTERISVIKAASTWPSSTAVIGSTSGK